MKCIELQSDIQFKEKFIQVSLLDFYKLYLIPLFMMSLLRSTYICEQIFSHTKHTKNNTRRQILDEHLENNLRIATTCIDELNFHIFSININIFFQSMRCFIIKFNIFINNIDYIELIKKYVSHVRLSINFDWPISPKRSK